MIVHQVNPPLSWNQYPSWAPDGVPIALLRIQLPAYDLENNRGCPSPWDSELCMRPRRKHILNF